MFMAGVGIGGMIAAVGGLLYVAIAVKSVFFGEKIDFDNLQPGMSGVPQGVAKLPAQAHDGPEAEAVHAKGAPGTVILAGIFLLIFVLYYFTNWKMLSMIWKIG